MAIDYSKWDKIELSDDSDVEVHPNVDKTSFIRWKQRDIHEKRIQRENQIKGLKIQKEMYLNLNKRVDSILASLSDDSLADESIRNNYLNKNFDTTEKCALEDNNKDGSPTYNEMVEDLFTQITEDIKKENLDLNGETLRSKILDHHKKIDDVLTQIDPKLEEFEQEKTVNITSDDIHDGWNSSFVNKKEDEKEQANKKKESIQEIETLNSSNTYNKPSKPIDELDELELLPETTAFSKLDKLTESLNFIKKNPFIANSHQKDALLMKSFNYQLNNDSASAKKIIFQSLLLQFSADLLENPPNPNMSLDMKIGFIEQFFNKLNDKDSQAKMMFDQEFNKTWEHIEKRCKIISEEEKVNEQPEEGVEQIQLRSMDPNSELIVNIPTKDTEEYRVFKTLPSDMQAAIESGKLDEINNVFSKMNIDDAEGVLDKFNQCGVIAVQALLENEEQFNELKNNEDQLNQFNKVKEKVQSFNIKEAESQAKKDNEDENLNTNDLVD